MSGSAAAESGTGATDDATHVASEEWTRCARAERRVWTRAAIRRLRSEQRRGADTPLLEFPLRPELGVSLYLKDESSHLTGSLKHRLASSLFEYALVNEQLRPGGTVVDASSGSTAVSEAYFARLLGLRFVAVVPASTAQPKLDLIASFGGEVHAVDDPRTVYREAERIAQESDGYYLDQFTFAERVTNWRDGNIASAVFEQMRDEPHPVPDWIVVGAGTGGTSATIGRYVRHRELRTRLCVVDPEASVFFDAWKNDDRTVTSATSSVIEGIGRPKVEASFVADVVDDMIRVTDAESIAAARFASERLGRRVGGSTGTNVWGALRIVADMVARGQRGSVVTVVCDTGDRYVDTYFDDEWVAQRGLDLAPALDALRRFDETGAGLEPHHELHPEHR